MTTATSSLWRNGAFLRMWSASTVSYFGSFITRTALPLAAIYVLGAGPLEIAALRSVEFIGLLIVGLVAGAWVDRLRRRPIMIWTDLLRAIVLGSIPVAAVGGVLGMPQLIVVAFVAAIASTFFGTASVAYLPTVVERDRLVAANSALSGSASVAEFTGFSVSGFLVQLFTAPIAIAVDAASFVGSAILLATIRRPEPPRPAVTDREPILREIREGLRVVLRSRVLLAIAAAHSATHILWGVFGTTYLLLATQEIGLGPAAIGIIAGIGGAGSFVGAALAERVVRRFGIGRTMLYGLIAMSAGNLLIPLAPSGAVLLGAAFLIGQQLIGDSGGTLYEVVETSLTQSIVDGRILGRVNATIELFTTILALAGAVLGGIVAEVLGLRAAMFAGVLGGATAIVFIWFSPIRSMVGPPPPLTIPPFTPERAPLVE